MRAALSGARAYRCRQTAGLLAGPLVSLACLAGAVAAFRAVVAATAGHGSTDGVRLAAAVALGWLGFAVVVALVPFRSRFGGDLVATDLLAVWRLWQLSPADLAAQRELAALQCRHELVLERFLAGDAEGALAEWQAIPVPAAMQWAATATAAVYVAATAGAAAALAVLDRAERELAAAAPMALPGATIDAGWRDEAQRVLDADRVFFATEAGADGAIAAVAASVERLRRLPSPPAEVARILGLHELHCGDLDAAARLLRTAWRAEEPFFLRAITALGLAVLRARRGDPAAARRWLAKATGLHPTSWLLPRYRALVENALAGRAASS